MANDFWLPLAIINISSSGWCIVICLQFFTRCIAAGIPARIWENQDVFPGEGYYFRDALAHLQLRSGTFSLSLIIQVLIRANSGVSGATPS